MKHESHPSHEADVIGCSLPLREFQNPLQAAPEAYTAPAFWTRANFTAAFMDTFAKSRGNVTAQQTILEYLSLHRGVDYRTTLLNFQLAGGCACLSGEERSLIVASFRKVQRHRAYFTHEEGRPLRSSQIFQRVDQFAKLFSLPLDVTGTLPIAQDELLSLPWPAFLKKLNAYIISVRL